MKISEYARRLASRVNEMLYEWMQGEPTFLYEASSHLLKAGGKRLRPTMLVLSSRVVGGDEASSLPAAAAIELLHNFTLVHDDIMDRDDFRRGLPTVHKIWGEATAILAGDLLFSRSFEMMLRTLDVGVPVERVIEGLKYLAWAATTVAEGQALDMSFEEKEKVSEMEYLEMVEKKTAALFKASMVIGAVIGGGEDKNISLLGEYGRLLGIAFQIQDDILGVVGDEKVLGKPVGSDIREGKKTIIIIHALENASANEREKILSVLGDQSASREEVQEVIDILRDVGSIDYARSKGKMYAEMALSKLREVDPLDEEAYSMLAELVEFVITREY